MGKAYDILIKARGDTRQAQRSMREFHKTVDRVGSGVRNSLGKMSKVAAASFGVGLALGVREGVSELLEAERVSGLTAVALRNTGNAAKLSVKDIEAMSGALLKRNGVDDQAIQSASNMLLTLGDLRLARGKEKESLQEATQAVIDYAVYAKKDPVQASQMMAKALADPEKAAGKLRKAGIQLSAQQTKLIESFTKTGDKAGAQGVIIDALGEKFKGSGAENAKTYTGQITIMREAFAGFASEQVAKVIPAIMGAAKWLKTAFSEGGKLHPIVTGLKAAWDGLKTGVSGAVAEFQKAVGNDGDGLKGMADAIEKVLKKAGKLASDILPKVGGALGDATAFVKKHKDALSALAVGVGAMVLAMKAWRTATIAATVAMGLLNVVMNANPIGVVILAIAGLTAGLVYAYKHSETFRNVVDKVWGALKKTWRVVMDNKQAFLLLVGPIGMAAAALITAYKHSETFRSGVHKVWDWVKKLGGLLKDFAGVVKSAFGDAAGYVKGAFLKALDSVLSNAEKVMKVLAKVPGPFQKEMKAAVKATQTARSGINAELGKIDGSGAKKQIDGVKASIDDVKAAAGEAWGALITAGLGALGRGTKAKGDAYLPVGITDPSAALRQWGLSKVMSPAVMLGQMMGMSISDGRRPPGTKTASGHVSDHSTGNAADFVGTPSQMAAFARAAMKIPGIGQVIYTPVVKTGNAKVDSMHYDHVHVAIKGGRRRKGTGDAYSPINARGQLVGTPTASSLLDYTRLKSKPTTAFLNQRILENQGRLNSLLATRPTLPGKLAKLRGDKKRQEKEVRKLYSAWQRAKKYYESIPGGKKYKAKKASAKKSMENAKARYDKAVGTLANTAKEIEKITGIAESIDAELFDVAGEIVSDQEALEGDGASGSSSTDGSSGSEDALASAQLEQVRQQLAISSGNTQLSEAALAAFSSSGDIGYGLGRNAAQSVTMVFPSSVPYTMQQAQQVSGMFMQGANSGTPINRAASNVIRMP